MSEEKCPLCGQEMNDTAKAAKVKKENLKCLYNKYYEGKDYHLKRFWENSIFVWTFLMVCFTAYGMLMNKFLDKELHENVKDLFPLFSIGICIIGCILSILWHQMAKASKAWYEVYESAIWGMESLNNEFEYDNKYLIHNFWATKDRKKGNSPSKIVILMGKVLIFFWILAIVLSIIIPLAFGDGLQNGKICYYVISFIIGALVTLLIIWLCKKNISLFPIKSSTLRDGNENDLFNQIKRDLGIQLQKKEHIYYEIKKEGGKKYIDFYFNDNNIDCIDTIMSLFVNGERIGYNMLRYKYSDIDDHYKSNSTILEQKIKYIQAQFNFRTILSKNGNIILMSTETKKDYDQMIKLLSEEDKGRIKQEGNKIIIPLECIKIK